MSKGFIRAEMIGQVRLAGSHKTWRCLGRQQ